jgi:hypothetical protein
MSSRWIAVLLALAIGGATYWFYARTRGGPADEPPQPPAPTAKPATPEPTSPTVAVPQRAPDHPVLPESGSPRPMLPDGGVPTPAQLYASEPRDLDWGPRTEKEIEQRLAHLKGANLESTECHVTQCQIALASVDTDALRVAIGELEAQRGLAGLATSMILSAPEKRADGSLLLRAYVSFER